MPPAKAGFDGYSLLVEPQRVVIAGDSPIGVFYGVYDALERLGCRWFQPALDPRDPEVVPKLADLALPAGQWSEASPLKLRIYNGSAFFFDLKPDQMIPQLGLGGEEPIQRRLLAGASSSRRRWRGDGADEELGRPRPA